MTRLAFVTVALFALHIGACTEHGRGGPQSDDTMEEGLTPAPRGGFCCPIDQGSCDCFRNGGWIADQSDTCPSICDLAPTNTRIVVDEHGCDTLEGPDSCLTPIDAGML